MRHLAALGWGLLVLAAVTAGAAAGDDKRPAPEPGGARKEGKPEDLNRLLMARHEVLQKTVRSLKAQYEGGRIDFGRLVQAQRELLKASLELPQPAEKRLAALRESRDLAETLLKIADGLWKGGRTLEVDALEAEAVLLEARIALLREQAKARPGK
jgi:outer membrane protein TolC